MTNPLMWHTMTHQGTHRATAEAVVAAIEESPELYLHGDAGSVAICIQSRRGHPMATLLIAHFLGTTYTVWPVVVRHTAEHSRWLTTVDGGTEGQGAVLGDWEGPAGWSNRLRAITVVTLVIARAIRANDREQTTD